MSSEKWVSVADDLPELTLEEWERMESIPVLVYVGFNRMMMATYRVDFDESLSENDLVRLVDTREKQTGVRRRWVSDCSECWDITTRVTHWRYVNPPE